MLWSFSFPQAESFWIGEVWENGKADKEIRNKMSREDQYSFCKDYSSLRRLGFGEAAILKHLPPPQQGPDLWGVREAAFRLTFVTINTKNYSSAAPWFLCLLASVLHLQLSCNSREATFHLYGDPRGKENQVCVCPIQTLSSGSQWHLLWWKLSSQD